MEDILALLVPIVALCIPIVAIWTKHQQRLAQIQADTQNQLGSDQAVQYSKALRELEERVRVLERIVTDKGYDVASQIEALRDTPAPTLQDRKKAEIL